MKFKLTLFLIGLFISFSAAAYDGEEFTVDPGWGRLVYRVISEEEATAEIIGHYSDEEIETYDYGGTWPKCFEIQDVADKLLNKDTRETKRYSIIAIADSAFQNWDKPYSIDMKRCSIIKRIGDYAFAGCSNLDNISMPNSLEEIGAHAFDGCANLFNAYLNDNIKQIGEYAFHNCSKLYIIHIPNPIVTIEEGTFQGCANLRRLIVPENVIEVGDYAFADCSRLEEVVIGKSVKSMGELILNHDWEIENLYSMPIIPPGTNKLSETYGEGEWRHGDYVGDVFRPNVYVPIESIKQYKRDWYFSIREVVNVTKCPYVFAIFAKDEYIINYSDYWPDHNQVTLDYDLLRLYDDIDVESMSWSVVNKEALDVIDGVAYSKGKVGERTRVTLTITDTYGFTYETSCFVYIGGNHDIISTIEADSVSVNGIYNLNGLRVGDSTEGLAPGLYIVREGSSTRKVMVR